MRLRENTVIATRDQKERRGEGLRVEEVYYSPFSTEILLFPGQLLQTADKACWGTSPAWEDSPWIYTAMNLWLKSSSYSSSWLNRSKPWGAKGAKREWSIFLKHKDPEHKQTLQAHSYKFPCYVKPLAIPMTYSWYIPQDNILDTLYMLSKTSESKHNNHWNNHYQANVLWTFLDLLYADFNLWSSEPWVSMVPLEIHLLNFTLKKHKTKTKQKARELSKSLNPRVPVQEEKKGQIGKLQRVETLRDLQNE